MTNNILVKKECTCNFLKNKKVWSEGLTKKTDKRLLKMSLSLKGKRRSLETEFKKGQIPWNKGTGVNKVCLTCDKEFYTILSKNKQGKGKFCSMSCRKNYVSKVAKEYKLNGDMAELIGVIIGDGCISKYWNKKSYRIFISGNKIEDEPYMKEYLPSLIKKCLNKVPSIYYGKNGALILQLQSESFRLFLKNLGIQENKTKTVRIPKEILDNKELLLRCIKGIADTDLTLIFTKRNTNKGFYPRISGNFASKNLVTDLEKALRSMEFTLNTMYDYKQKDNRFNKEWTTNRINLEGPHNLARWMNLIGFSNKRILSRYELWQKKGFLDSKTTLPQRLESLSRVGGGVHG